MSRKILKRTSNKLQVRGRRKIRIRKKIIGTADRPRLCITRSNIGMYAQLIDDVNGVTLFGLSSAKKQRASRVVATALGKKIAEEAGRKGITTCVFDRSGHLFHGRVAALAQGARDGGLKF